MEVGEEGEYIPIDTLSPPEVNQRNFTRKQRTRTQT